MTLEDIEKKMDISKFQHKGVKVWPIVKTYLIDVLGTTPLIKKATPNTLKILAGNLFPDLWSLANLTKSRNWVFTNSERRYHINETSFDRVSSGLLNYIGDYVLFENPIPKGRTPKDKLLVGEHYLGMSYIFLFQFLWVKLSQRPRIEHLDFLAEYLQKDLGTIENVYHRICAGEVIYDWLIRLFKPKVIFVVCYYSNYEVIKAAKKNNIPVVELQHGLVAKSHRAYYFSNDVGNQCLPDYFLSYGSYFSQIVSEGNVVEQKNILNYGYSFLEEANKELHMSDGLRKKIKNFNHFACITGQLEETNTSLLALISSVCEEFPNTLFIYKPRNKEPLNKLGQKKNLVDAGDLNTYELLKYCAFHITVYSTCAIEALAFGRPNISVDINGKYRKYLKHILNGNPYNYVVESENDLLKVLVMLKEYHPEKKSVKKTVENIFSPMVPTETFFHFFDEVIQ